MPTFKKEPRAGTVLATYPNDPTLVDLPPLNNEVPSVPEYEEGIPVKHVDYAHLLAKGETYPEAWRKAQLGPYTKARAIKLAETEEIKEIIRDIRKKAEDDSVMSLREKRQMLAQICRTPIGDLTKDSPLTKELKMKSIPGRGDEGDQMEVEVKGMDKLKAMELDSKLAGDFDKDDAANSESAVMAEFIARIRKSYTGV